METIAWERSGRVMNEIHDANGEEHFDWEHATVDAGRLPDVAGALQTLRRQGFEVFWIDGSVMRLRRRQGKQAA